MRTRSTNIRRAWHAAPLTGAALLLVCGLGMAEAQDGSPPATEEASASPVAVERPTVPAPWAPAVEPKALSTNVKRGLSWLLETQRPSGGWSQGEESRQMGPSLQHLADKPNVGDTCVALLAILRAGSTPSEGPFARSVLAGVRYVCSEVEESDKDSLYVTSTRGTRLQMKLGTYIDTFLTSMLLAEVKGKMPDQEGERRVLCAMDKVMDKIEKNQRPDGTFGGSGWANTLSQAMAAKGINRIAQAGGEVKEEVRARLESYAQKQFDKDSGSFSGEGAAGVDLYSTAANLGALQDSENTNSQKRAQLADRAANAPTQREREEASQLLDRFNRNGRDLVDAREAVTAKLDDERFIAGFGSNGGEEFLSYMNIGESLVAAGGEEWKKWDEKITENMNHIQNQDGSWTGHHCITGRTFCTSAALLVLMTDRAPVPVASGIRRR